MFTFSRLSSPFLTPFVALGNLQECLRRDPDHSTARTKLKLLKDLERLRTAGNDAFKRHDHAAAIESYTAALEVDPANAATNSRLFNNRAIARFALRQYEEACDDCGKAIELDAEFVKAYRKRAECWGKLEKWQEAVYDLEKAKSIEPDDKGTGEDGERVGERGK